MKAEICEGEYFSELASTQASPLSARTMLKGTSFLSFSTVGSSKRRPIRRFTANRVFSGLVTAWRLAGWPTRRSPSSLNATIEGVVRAPSAFSITLALAPSITATQEFVVPRSMPITLAIVSISPHRQAGHVFTYQAVALDTKPMCQPPECQQIRVGLNKYS